MSRKRISKFPGDQSVPHLRGLRFGRWLVLHKSEAKNRWFCVCDCGTSKDVIQAELLNGNSRSCGCLRLDLLAEKTHDLSGRRFGRLAVISKAHKGRHRYWLCRCDCGNEKTIIQPSLLNGTTRSCGCLHREILLGNITKHGGCYSREYNIWCGIKSRCLNPNEPAYKNYGGRGISVCDRWRDSFEAFFEDMGSSPSDLHSIERMDNDGNYCPGNCKWATTSEQSLNRRNNHLIEYKGSIFSLHIWAQIKGMKRGTLVHRLKRGWSVEKSLETPVVPAKPRPESEYRAKRLSYSGKTMNLAEWSRETGIRAATIGLRIKKGWSVEATLTTPSTPPEKKAIFRKTGHFMTCNGETRTMSEWSRITGIKFHTIKSRVLALGWSDEKALTTPVQK